MIERYSLPEMDAIFSDAARFARYLDIELHALDGQAAIGVVPTAAAAACRARAPKIDPAFVAAVSEREAVTNHDVAAFVDVVQERIGGPDAAWLHHGLTSSDVVDTAWCAMLRDSAELIDSALGELIAALVGQARAHRDTAMIGRTHGMHAEPTTFGAKVALWALQVDRDRRRMKAARYTISVCKLSGAVGTYSNIDPRVEQHVAAAMGLRAVPATQVISRDRHAEFLSACAGIASTIEMIAVELRHLQRTEVSAPRCRRFARASHRARRAVRRCRTSGIRFLPRRSPVSPGSCAETCRPVCRTSPCGTSETSRTPRSSASFFPTPRR
ncbi:MAG: adenylosuccinate lyase [Actinomycetota bacterium]